MSAHMLGEISIVPEPRIERNQGGDSKSMAGPALSAMVGVVVLIGMIISVVMVCKKHGLLKKNVKHDLVVRYDSVGSDLLQGNCENNDENIKEDE